MILIILHISLSPWCTKKIYTKKVKLISLLHTISLNALNIDSINKQTSGKVMKKTSFWREESVTYGEDSKNFSFSLLSALYIKFITKSESKSSNSFKLRMISHLFFVNEKISPKIL